MKNVLAVIILLFPYSVAFGFYCLLSGFLMESVFDNNFFLILFLIAVFWVIAFICAIALSIIITKKKEDYLSACRMNMLIKTLAIPAYIYIFGVGLLFSFTVFTVGVTFVLWILDLLSISLSAMVGVSAIKCSRDNKILSRKQATMHMLFQFVFVADVISALIVFRKVKQTIIEV